MAQRLDKILSSQGVTTRSVAQRLIRSGKLSVNGVIMRDPSAKIEPEDCEILLEGKVIKYKKNVYIIMNKPSGLLCVSRDNKAPTVLDLLPGDMRRPGLFPAGRLDKDTVGLVIITDDGDFAHRMLSPKKEILKKYRAVLDGPVGDDEIRIFSEGTILKDGTVCRPAELSILKDGANPLVEVGITEGRYHQVKRMFFSVGRRVLRLKRISIGKLFLDESLKEGDFREMTEDEKNLIFQ
jgi:16S rRNA pseudouridine516 synthase